MAYLAPELGIDKVIDTHIHLWDKKKFYGDWLNSKGCESINRTFTNKEYSSMAQTLAKHSLRVEGGIYLEVDVNNHMVHKEIEHITTLCKSNDSPLKGCVIKANPNDPKSFDTMLNTYKDNSFVKGIRKVLHVSFSPLPPFFFFPSRTRTFFSQQTENSKYCLQLKTPPLLCAPSFFGSFNFNL